MNEPLPIEPNDFDDKANSPDSEFKWPEIPPRTKLSAINDPLDFRPNRCSPNARQVFSIVDDNHWIIWIDKHYLLRHQFGDENGKREGIDPEVVNQLVKKSTKYLFAFASIVKSFSFINHGSPDPSTRVVLQQRTVTGMLNVVVEAHFETVGKCEITIKTALVTEDFRLTMGQYAVEITEGGAILKRKDNNDIIEVFEI